MRNIRNARLFRGMQKIPSLGVDAVVVKRLVAGNTPHIGRDAVFFLEKFLRLQRFAENCAAAKDLRAKF